ncbi:hypothetical protein LTR37_010297 [Vermiconidia calcicola]|uniref:Uncharacterized protein n=1 Tax=Vermiconidia calcicola TaxID=1690605 RepID=A0ACC3N5R0_9PEZI|nr:hypothetical protein LTR37_010297 [Vermiconidia calcicola]
MACPPSEKKPPHESRREREFYRHYEPIRALSENGPPFCDLINDPAATQTHRPFSCPDRALTAFCQLGALRLGARRAMLFFFDTSYGYVLAESTRTLSLQDDSVHAPGDDLWLGHAIIPRGCAVCEHTVNLPSFEDSIDGDSSVHIINDLTKDQRFCDAPFVASRPNARFYAGVPITTGSKGINIGAYCVLDDKPRDGLDDDSIAFLRDMAAAVMTHLEMVRTKADHKRGTTMISRLSAFIEGTEKLPEPPASASQRSVPRSGSVSKKTSASMADKASDSQMSSPKLEGTVEPPPLEGRGVGSIQEARAMPPTTSHAALPVVSRTEQESQMQPTASRVRTTFERAAHLIRDATDADGAMFLDASVRTYGGLLDKSNGSEQSSDSGLGAVEGLNEHKEGHNGRETPKRQQCPVLTSSRKSSNNSPDNSGTEIPHTDSMDEQFLRSLLRRYPRGVTFSYSGDGDVSSDSESSESTGLKSGDDTAQGSDARNGDLSRKERRKRSHANHSEEIRRLLPGVRSFALVGVWDQVRDRWLAACAIWTYSPLRIFSNESELSYMTAFCDVLMAEVQRLEAQISDNAKTDFISSISHELRSPLHGILGSVEILAEQAGDSFSKTLIDQIDTCGRTLVDIVDNLLEYAKINNLARKQSVQLNGVEHRKDGSMHTSRAQIPNSIRSLRSDVALDAVTEEVIQTTVYSFCCSKEPQANLDRKVTMTFDIDGSLETNWKCRIATGGWKRLCINLVSNALKYTSEGYIRVSLGATPAKGSKQLFNAVLTVEDSGCGMSKQFIENHLFKPFTQEDGLVEGTGLGMSLCARIVKSFGGKIEVQSVKGKGTTVTVLVPMDHASDNQAVETESPSTQGRLRNMSTAIIDSEGGDASLEEDQQTSREIGVLSLYKSLRRTCAHLGLRISQGNMSNIGAADLYLITERDFRDQALGALADKTMVIVCESVMSERRMRSSPDPLPRRSVVEFISQPVGPDRLRQAIQACLSASSKGNGHMALHSTASGGLEANDVATPLGKTYRFAERKQFNRADSDGMSPTSMSRKPLLEPSAARQPEVESSRPALPPEKPLFESSESSTELARDSSAVQPGATQLSPVHKPNRLPLLLVDDNHINLRLLVTYAEKRDHPNLTARDGLEAFEVYKAACSGLTSLTSPHVKPPKVILMDINMPIFNGFEASRHIRNYEQQEGLAPAYIIALTGLGDASAQQEAHTSGMNMFLTKPVRLKELTRILDGIENGG